MVLKTTGLAGRDFELTNAPKSVKLYNTDDFQVSAVSATPGAAVSLEVSTWRVCLHADGRQYRAPFFPSAMSSPQRFVVKSYGCDPGWFLDILQFQIQAVARKGEAIGKSAKATLTFSPWLLEVPVDVLEQACGWTQVPSVSVQPGDRVNITAGGTIKTVIWWPFDGWQVGAAGMTHSPATRNGRLSACRCSALRPDRADCLVGRALSAGAEPRLLLRGHAALFRAVEYGGRLYLRVNDNEPGNGSAAFTANVRIWRR